MDRIGSEIVLFCRSPSAEGAVSAEAVAATFTKDTVLVTVMHANNETARRLRILSQRRLRCASSL